MLCTVALPFPRSSTNEAIFCDCSCYFLLESGAASLHGSGGDDELVQAGVLPTQQRPQHRGLQRGKDLKRRDLMDPTIMRSTGTLGAKG